MEDFFDLNGNLKSMEHLKSLTRDYRNMISMAAKPKREDGTQDLEYYIYNSGGNRVRKITVLQDRTEEKIYLDGVEIKRIYQGGVLKLERWDHHVMDDTKRIAVINTWMKDLTARETEKPLTYVIDLDTGEKIDPDTGKPFVPVTKTRYQYGNHLGSASLELDKTGAFVSYQEYFPFGGTSYTVGQVSSEYRFTGKELDEFTGLYYFGARYYASWIGRWCSADPKRENEDGINLYAYCRNNPITMVDPNGMQGEVAEVTKQVFVWSPFMFNFAQTATKAAPLMGTSGGSGLGAYFVVKGGAYAAGAVGFGMAGAGLSMGMEDALYGPDRPKLGDPAPALQHNTYSTVRTKENNGRVEQSFTTYDSDGSVLQDQLVHTFSLEMDISDAKFKQGLIAFDPPPLPWSASATGVKPRTSVTITKNMSVDDIEAQYIEVHGSRLFPTSFSSWGDYLTKIKGPAPLEVEQLSAMLGVKPHAHHIVFKGNFSHWKNQEAINALKGSKQILKDFGIDLEFGSENLVWAPNLAHTQENAIKVFNELQKAVDSGLGKDAVINALQKLGERFANGEM